MKNYSFLLLMLSSSLCYAQFGPQRVISTNAGLPVRAITGDINGDGFIDVAVASRSSVSSNVSWYSNIDGGGNFGSVNTIGGERDTMGIDVSDLDGDGDLDVLSSNLNSDVLIWHENLDGLGNFGSENTIATSIDAFFCLARDMDGDMIPDVIVSIDNQNTITWYKNDGNGNFSSPITIGNQGNIGRYFDAKDLDNDGDLDIVAVSSSNEAISWYENEDGLGNFGPHQVIEPDIFAKISVDTADIDNNGFLDIIATSAGEDTVSWYANNGNGTFGNEQIITMNADFAVNAKGGDLDNDGDIDVVYTSALDNTVAWHENLDGLGTFGPQQNLSTDAVSGRHVHIADIDNDGDMDVLSASQNDNKIAWYENLTILDVEDVENSPIAIYPNPASDDITIQLTDVSAANYNVTLTNSLGQRLATYDQNAFVNNSATLSVASLANGLYFVTVEAGKASKTMKLIVE